MKDFKQKIYYNPKGCAPLAMRQLTNKPDHEVVSACILHGYDPVKGGMTPLGFRAAAQQLGIYLSDYHTPKRTMTLLETAVVSKACNETFVVGVQDHVLVIRQGKIIDPVNTPLTRPVDLVMWEKKNEKDSTNAKR